jgi:hypothetical protein
MKISDLMIKEEMLAWVEFREGMQFQLRYISRSDLTRLAENCKTWKFSHDHKTKAQQLDHEEFTKKFCARAIVGWKGVTPRSLANTIPIDLTKFTEEQLDAPIDFEQENLVSLIKGAYQLDDFLQDCATDIKVFRPELEDQLKNSKPSQPMS